MGFWSSVGNIAKGAVDSVVEKANEADELAQEYRGEDDDYLKRKFKIGGTAERFAAAKVLKERGYGNQD